MRKAIMAAAGAAVFFFAGGLWAQPFSSQGTFAISAERVFGLPWYESTHVEWDHGRPPDNDEEDHSRTSWGIAWAAPATPYAVPRFAVDYFVIDHLSIGGALAFVSASDDTDGPGGDVDRSAFLLAPRVGYAIPFGAVAGFWPRGGLTFVSEGGDGDDGSELALTLEPLFWLAPAEGVAFVLGPVLDVGLVGSWENDDTDEDGDFRRTAVGISVGLMGWF